mmetsp:Transcript_29866/g.78640  ORF Transcript_29866/g.78640 Transcript_29866/m.78640 type:complete len:302 (+) Transcript_29866:182-1087(+)
MADAGTQILVLIVAMFGVPKLMSVMPDIDPLVMIVGLFLVLALLQQLGFQTRGASGEESQHTQRPKYRAAPEEHHEESSSVASTDQMLTDATRAMEQNNYQRAQELARRVADMDPESARAWELLAAAQKWQGLREEAAATVRKAMEIYEVESDGLRALARELERSESPQTIAMECEKKGEGFFSRRQYDLAVDCYTKALEVFGNGKPNSANGDKELLLRLRSRRAECAQQLQDWSTCRHDATVLLEADPLDQRALMQRAAANEALEKFKDALADARKLMTLNPKSIAANRIAHNCQQALRS